jgi:hypothetical protein
MARNRVSRRDGPRMTRSVMPFSRSRAASGGSSPQSKTDRQTMVGRGSTPMKRAGPLQNRSESGAGHLGYDLRQAVTVVLVRQPAAEMTLSNSDP